MAKSWTILGPSLRWPHVGLGYPFTLLYLERADRTIAHVESLTNADYLPKPKQTVAHEHPQ
ncbi:MAG: hypothetical protein ACRDQ5_02035 [Sciscionella sp.]